MAGSVVWFEVMGQDHVKLQSFYGELFGWSFQNDPDKSYGMVSGSSTIPGGVGAAPKGPGWTTFYVEVDDLRESIKKATELGSKVLMEPVLMPEGDEIALIADPEGHPVGLVTTSCSS